jgi:hypothetical protein
VAPALRSHAGLWIVLALTALACGGSRATGPGAKPPAAVRPTAPALPEEPLDLIPAGATEVARANVERLRGSSLFATLEGWMLRYSCASGERSHFLAHRTTQLALATYAGDPPGPSEEGVLVLRGTFTHDDALRALAASTWLAGGQRGPVKERKHGAWLVLSDGVASAVLLSAELLAVGHEGQVARVLAIADGKGTSIRQDPPLFSGLDALAFLPEQTLGLVARLSERRARRVGRSLTDIGGSGLAHGLDRSSASFALTLARELRAQLRVQYPEVASAAGAASELRGAISRAGFVLRFLGLRALVDRLDIQAEGPVLQLTLDVSEQDARDLLDRLTPLVDGEAPSCPSVPAGQMAGDALDAPGGPGGAS